MTITKKPKIIYDIESLPNFFCVVFCKLDSDDTLTLEINDSKNDRKSILSLLNHYTFIGYNNHRYDDILLNYIIDTPNCTAKSINEVSQKIIKSNNNKDIQKELSPFKHQRYFNSIDVCTMLASSKLRVSLKHLQVMCNWNNVLEFECDWKTDLPKERWEDCKAYCLNDVLSLKHVCDRLVKQFELRDYVHEKTNLDVHSKDPVKIAEITMANAIAQHYNVDINRFMWDVVKSNRPIGNVQIAELILPFIKFKTKKFNDALEKYRAFVLNPETEKKKPLTKRFSNTIIINDLKLNLGLGGIHHEYSSGKIFKQSTNNKIIQSDIVSFYPSIRIEHLTHKFDPSFISEYKLAYEEKARGKSDGNKLLESYAKLKLNSSFGLYNSIYSVLFDPKLAYATTVNGQLMLAMLIEELLIAEFKIIGANTDAVNVIVPTNRWDEYLSICGKWEVITAMKLEHDEFLAIYEQSCNNYIAVKSNGKIKTKGSFVPELDLLKGYDCPIVKVALIQYFTKNSNVSETIKNHDNIFDFCMSTKMGISKNNQRFEAIWKHIKLQQTNRYYASTSSEAAHLYKKAGKDMEHVLKDSPVMIFNYYEYKPMKEYEINYQFYINKAKKILYEIEPQQQSLF